MFHVVYRNDSTLDASLLGSFNSLKDAANARSCSGDLVIDSDGKVVQHDSWLFDWEKEDPNCYAHRLMLGGASVNRVFVLNGDAYLQVAL